MDSHCLWLTNSLWPIAGRRRRHTEDSPLIGGELSIPPDEGETDEPRRATFSIPGGGDDGGGGAVDDAAAICPSLNGKASMYLAGVHGASWPSASTRSPAAPWVGHSRTAPTALRPRARRVLIRTMLSGWAYGAI